MKTFYFADEAGHSIARFNGTTFASPWQIQNFPTNASPQQLAVRPVENGTQLYAADLANNQIHVVSIDSSGNGVYKGACKLTTPACPAGNKRIHMGLHPDGKYLYVSSSGALLTYDTNRLDNIPQDTAPTSTLTIPCFPYPVGPNIIDVGLVITANGNHAYSLLISPAGSFGSMLSKVSLAQPGQPRIDKQNNLPGASYQDLAVSPDGSRVVLTSANNNAQLFVFDTSTLAAPARVNSPITLDSSGTLAATQPAFSCSGKYVYVLAGSFGGAQGQGKIYKVDANTWTQSGNPGTVGNWPWSICVSDDDQTAFIGDGGPNSCYQYSLTSFSTQSTYSTSSTIWNIKTLRPRASVNVSIAAETFTSAFDLYGVAYNGSKFVGVGSAGGSVVSTDDGLTWATTAGSFATTSKFFSVGWFGDKFYAVRQSTSSQNPVLYYSTDGVSWTSVVSTSPYIFNKVAVKDNTAYLVGYSNTAGLIGWVNLSDPASTVNIFSEVSGAKYYGITYENGMFMAVGTGFRKSTSGNDWSGNSSWPVTATQYGVCWSSFLGLWVTVGEFGKIIVSEDGNSWTNVTSGTTSHLMDVKWIPDQRAFVAVGNRTVLTSVDGRTWVSRTLPTNLATIKFTGLATKGSVAVAVGTDDTGYIGLITLS